MQDRLGGIQAFYFAWRGEQEPTLGQGSEMYPSTLMLLVKNLPVKYIIAETELSVAETELLVKL